jgi:hypothetical protein
MQSASAKSVFDKLNLGLQKQIVVYAAPASFEGELTQLKTVSILRDPKNPAAVKVALAFVTAQKQLDRLSALLAKAAEGDALLWFAYPKGTSKRYRCEFNRDTGWDVMRKAGFDTVRAVAIDEDWSALRFRRLEYVKSLTRPPSKFPARPPGAAASRKK